MENFITCPKCQTTLDVEQAIKEQLEKGLNADFIQKESAMEQKFKERELVLSEKETKLAQEKERQDRIISEKLKEAEVAQRSLIEKEQAEKNALEIESLKRGNKDKQEAIKEMQMRELDLLKQQTQLREEREALELTVARTIANERKAIEDKACEKVREENFLKAQENEHLISNLKQQLEVMQRKMEQGSMQVQGEVMEVELEKLLTQSFPFDEITPVGKGANGADILHKVRNHQMADCGTIIFESKRTKSFSVAWIEKLKADCRLHRGQLAVLVSEVLPQDLKQFGLKDGVWICTYHEAVALVTVLRYSLLTLHDQKAAGENKGEKQQMLYDYLTSYEFAHQIEFVMSGYRAMQETLDKEKKVMTKNWKERQKQIEMMTKNTIDIYGSVKGIAGSSVKKIDELEFDDLLLTQGEEEQANT